MATVREQSELTLVVRRTFPARAERLFQAWTTPEALKRWCAPGPMTVPAAEVDLRVGGAFRIVMRGPDGAAHNAVGVYREIDPPRKLVFTWRWEDKPEMGETLVTLEFLAADSGTEVVLTHSGFPNESERRNHETGWMGCLEKLATAV